MIAVLRTAAMLGVLAAIVATAGQAAPSANPIKSCPAIKGPTWQFPHTSLKGNNYGSYVVGGYSCATAATWIKKLTPTTLKNRTMGSSNVLTNGPAGFKCTANPDANGHAFAGSCRKGKGAATVGFGWGSGRP